MFRQRTEHRKKGTPGKRRLGEKSAEKENLSEAFFVLWLPFAKALRAKSRDAQGHRTRARNRRGTRRPYG
jgi:hypothetical protein